MSRTTAAALAVVTASLALAAGVLLNTTADSPLVCDKGAVSYKPGTVTYKGSVVAARDDTHVLVSRDGSTATHYILPCSALTALAPPPPPTGPTGPITGPSGPTGPLGTDKVRPYAANSPWNTPVGNAATHPNSATYMNALKSGPALTSDPDQYTIPVVVAPIGTPEVNVYSSGTGKYLPSDQVNRVVESSPVKVPVPAGTIGGAESDGQLEILRPETGEQWGFWQLSPRGDGNYDASNQYHTTYDTRSMGRFKDGQRGRGAGTEYLAGLVRPWEVAQGHIDHALAFGTNYNSSAYTYPASKSDGGGGVIPEGTRFVLDASYNCPGLTNNVARVICRAMQLYGFYDIDNSGSSKIYLEERSTAKWDSSVTRSILSSIPWSSIRAVVAPSP